MVKNLNMKQNSVFGVAWNLLKCEIIFFHMIFFFNLGEKKWLCVFDFSFDLFVPCWTKPDNQTQNPATIIYALNDGIM